jgi:1-phosphofructokinase
MNAATKVVTLTLNPAIDQTLSVQDFRAGELNRVLEVRQNAGGKGVNVASALADLGVPVVATGFLGRENAGLFESLFRAKAIGDRFVRLAGSTRMALKLVDKSCQKVTEVNYPGLSPEAVDLETLLETVTELAAPGTWFALSGSLPPGVPADLYAALIRGIRSRGAKVALDTSGEPLRLALAEAPDIVKPNQHELEQLTGATLTSLDDVAEAASHLIAKGIGLVAISMGAKGALFAQGAARLVAIPPSVPLQSTVGAGDTMVAGLLCAQLQGQNLSNTARLATACGAHAVTRIASGVDPAAVRTLQELVDLTALHA